MNGNDHGYCYTSNKYNDHLKDANGTNVLTGV